MQSRMLRTIWKKCALGDKSNEPKFGFEIELYEAAKHSFGTYYVNNGISNDLLKEWFGHASIKSAEIYAKIRVVDAFRQI